MMNRAAQHLFDAHERRERFAPIPANLSPATAHEAYAIQDAFVAARAQARGAIVGYKIALSTPAMQRFVGLHSPLAGALLESTLLRSPASVRAADHVRLIVEFEIGVRMASDLPAADAPFTRERVMQSAGTVMAALEIADDRGADYALLARHPLDLVADNAWNEGAVLGPETAEWRGIDLAAVRGVARINGAEAGQGVGADTMGHPMDALAWIANHLASAGRGLLRGDVVITGSLVTSKHVKAGDVVEFALDGLGAAELRVE